MKLKLALCSLLLLSIGCGSSKPPAPAADPTPEPLMPGPTENSGVESLQFLGSIPLGVEFDGMSGRDLRAREITLAPGGEFAVHRHESRPGVAYVVEGQVVEYRKNQGKKTRRAGEVAFETNGLVHWWKNESSENARVLVVDIVTEGSDH